MPTIRITEPPHADLIREAVRFFQGRADPHRTATVWGILQACIRDNELVIDDRTLAGMIEHGLITLAWERRQEGNHAVADLADHYADRIALAFGRETYKRVPGYPWPKTT